jgi:hypothetical protein
MSGSLDVASMLRQLAEQQSALGEQKAALLQLQTEIVRMQRTLIERAIGEPAQMWCQPKWQNRATLRRWTHPRYRQPHLQKPQVRCLSCLLRARRVRVKRRRPRIRSSSRRIHRLASRRGSTSSLTLTAVAPYIPFIPLVCHLR